MESAAAIANNPGQCSSSSAKCVPIEGVPSAADVVRALRRTDVVELSSIEPEVVDRGVVLRGCVGSYYLKQRAQIAVRAIPGVDWVRNELDVVRDHPGFTTSP